MKVWHDGPVRAWTPMQWMTLGFIAMILLAIALIVIVPAFAAIQREPPACRVTALVYAAEDLAQVDVQDVKVPFGCPIDVARFERRLVLTSRTWYVEIEIPRAGGWMRFAYTWGRDQAYLGPRAIPVTNGPLVGG